MSFPQTLDLWTHLTGLCINDYAYESSQYVKFLWCKLLVKIARAGEARLTKWLHLARKMI